MVKPSNRGKAIHIHRNLFQFVIEGSDEGLVENTAQVPVSVYVSRNRMPPMFIGTPYSVEVSENLAVNGSVFHIIAEDIDLQVIFISAFYPLSNHGRPTMWRNV